MAAEWTQAADERLRALWAEGLSTARIGHVMGLTKNAVVGRAHRLKLPSRPTPIRAPALTAPDAERIRDMVRRGDTLTDIARQMRTGRETLRRFATEHGIALPRNAAEAQPRPRTNGVRSLHARGAAALARAQDSTQTLRAEAFRRHAQPGGGVQALGPVAQPIPALPQAVSGDPARAGHPEAGGDAGCGVSSLALPPAVATPRPGVFSPPGARACRWPMWGNDERPTQEFCGSRVRLRADGVPCVYCAQHAGKAFNRVAEPVEELPHRVTRATFAWGGKAA